MALSTSTSANEYALVCSIKLYTVLKSAMSINLTKINNIIAKRQSTLYAHFRPTFNLGPQNAK